MDFGVNGLKVIILTPQKTGTVTLHNTFREYMGYSVLCTHHNLSDKDDLYSYFRSIPTLHIITTYREPFSRIISNYFERKHLLDNEKLSWPIDRLIEDFLAEWELYSNGTDTAYSDIKDITGVDILSVPFDKEKGYSHIKHENFIIHVLRFDKIKQWESYLQQDFPEIKFITGNISSTKSYAKLYSQFLVEFKYPQDVRNKMYHKHINIIRHFYIDEDVQRFVPT